MTEPVIEDHTFDELSTFQFHDLVRLRVDVFVVEQGCPYPELDGRDTEPSTRHVWIADAESQPRAYLRLLSDGTQRRIGRVVVRPDSRAEGLGGRLVTYVTDVHAGPWVLDAQTHLRDWYARLGFAPTGPEFVDAGIRHVPMRREVPR